MRLRAPRVLIVEDDFLVRLDTAMWFEDAGWSVVLASTAEEGLDLLEDPGRIDAVFTDVQLAGTMTGIELASSAIVKDPALPVIVNSGRPIDRSQLPERAVFIPKPYQPTEVVALLKVMIDGGQSQ